MISTDFQADQEEMWRTLFDENHGDLATAAEMLLRCRLGSEKILREALTVLEGSPCEAAFGQALRTVVEAAVAYNRETANAPIQAETSTQATPRFLGSSQIGKLPWPERAVYFLRGVLRYSCQETALLLGMSDANIDELYKFAAKRIAY